MKNRWIITSRGKRQTIFQLLILPGIVLLISSLSACQSQQTQKSSLKTDNTAIKATRIDSGDNRNHQQLIANKQLAIGFTQDEVIMAWGEPEYRKKPDDLYDEKNRKVNPSGGDNIETWYYTVTTRQRVYILKKHINEQTGAVEFREETQHVLQEHVTRTVEFKEGKIILWRVHLGSELLKPVETSAETQ